MESKSVFNRAIRSIDSVCLSNGVVKILLWNKYGGFLFVVAFVG